MNTATKVRDLSGFTGHAALYRLSTPLRYDDWGAPKDTELVVVSAVHCMGMPETNIFPADVNGIVTDWVELDGSLKGTLDHGAALAGAGYIIVGSEAVQ